MNFESTLPRVTFDDVAGNEAAMAEIRELVTFLTEPEIYTRMGCKIPKGYLLSGTVMWWAIITCFLHKQAIYGIM